MGYGPSTPESGHGLAFSQINPGRPTKVTDPFPDQPPPEGVTVSGEVYRTFGRPCTHCEFPGGFQVGDRVYTGEGSKGKTPREITHIEYGGGSSWPITTADGEVTRVPAMKDTILIRPDETSREA